DSFAGLMRSGVKCARFVGETRPGRDEKMSDVWILRGAGALADALPGLPEARWRHAVLKPNWVRHYNERDPSNPGLLDEVVTAPELLFALARQLASRAESVTIADAPQFDADWSELWRRLQLDGLLARARGEGIPLDIRDLRQEVVRTDANGVIL